MVWGAYRAQKLIMTHPNHDHLLNVLSQTRSEVLAGRAFGGRQSSSEMSPDSEQSESWPSERQNTFPASSSGDSDENSLLTDDQINQQGQERKSEWHS
jgi:hypothetical protein